jgi:hypothetical protein
MSKRRGSKEARLVSIGPKIVSTYLENNFNVREFDRVYIASKACPRSFLVLI